MDAGSHAVGRSDRLPDVAQTAPAMSQNVAKCRGLSQARETCETNPFGPELTPRQRAAIKALVEGASVTAVAQLLGVERRTVGRWKKLPTFVAEVQRCCAPNAGTTAQRVEVTRMAPKESRIERSRRRTRDDLEWLLKNRPKQYTWNGVTYDTF